MTGGVGWNSIGRPCVITSPMYPPPMKPSGPWSKLSLTKSAITVPHAPERMNGLMFTFSSKNTCTPLVVW